MRPHRGKLMQQANPVFVGFPHSDNAATTNRDPSLSDMFQRAQTIVIFPSCYDLPIECDGRIKVVIVGVEACIGQTLGLRFAQHAEGTTYFQTERRNTADHLEHGLELRTVVYLTPGGAHAESCDALLPCILRCLDDVLYGQQIVAFDAGFIVRALRTVSAILRTTAGLDRQQLAKLHFSWVEELSMYCLSQKQGIEQACVVNGSDFLASPIVVWRTRLHGR